MASPSQFWNRPIPQQGPDVPYYNKQDSNPVLRGFAIAPLAILIRSSPWLQGILWRLNKFHKLKELPQIEPYSARYDPTVIPILKESDAFTLSNLPQPQRRKNSSQYYTCADYHELYKSKQITPLQVAEYLVSIISRPSKDAVPDRYNVAYIATKPELVLAAARASTERYKKGEYISVLDGVPVAVKDEIELEGYRKMQGSSIDFTGPKGKTGWCVQKWQDAGAIVIGKTNMHEIGMDTTGFNSTWGTPLNPHNEGYYTGGSSSGSACTVAHGICPIALGADGGGSIRLPSSFCGLYGLKPSHGRVSGAPTAGLADSVGVYGPMAASLDDLELAYRVMAQPDPSSTSSALFPNTFNKIGIQSSWKKVLGIDRTWLARSDPVVIQMLDEAVSHYSKNCGYQVIDISIPCLPEGQKAHALTILTEVRTGIHTSMIPKLSYHNQVLLSAIGSQASAEDFLASQKIRCLQMEHLAWLWEKYPDMLILTPTVPFPGWKIGHPSDVSFRGNGASDSDTSLRSMEYVYFANWTGAPAISMPMGYSDENVPVGLMAMGEWGSEEQLFSWAREGDGILRNAGIRRPKPEGHWVDVLENVQRSRS